jgi:signal peptidase I
MVDEPNPSQPSDVPAPTDVQATKPPSPGPVQDSPTAPTPAAPANTPPASELVRFLGWVAGLVVVLCCGWGLLFVAFYFTRNKAHPDTGFALATVLDLGLFFLLERRFRLSRLMGLRIAPWMRPWSSAILLWLLGVPGLLFRSTSTQAAGEPNSQPRSSPQPKDAPADTLREIIETVVFVVVLVLMLRSFVAEAFVIPTGSMAETLYGYQKTVTCPDCGNTFEVNCSDEVEERPGRPRRPITSCICPYCRLHIRFGPAGTPPRVLDNDEGVVPNPGWNSGDRVLVTKLHYDLIPHDPERHDVVVFRFPGDASFPRSGPYSDDTQMNYIKRLIGKPGETIAIHRGKIYVLPPEMSPKWPDYDEAKGDPSKMAVLWQKEHMHMTVDSDDPAQQLFRRGRFQIVRRDPDVMRSMMRPVYDHDHPSRFMPERWSASNGGWRADGRAFRSEAGAQLGAEAGAAGGYHVLRYQNFCNRNHPQQPELITDFMGYNTFGFETREDPFPSPKFEDRTGHNWVSDLILECEVVVGSPAGELVLELSKGADRFQAHWDLTSADGLCTLYRITNDGTSQKLDARPTSLRGRGTYFLRFANVDDRLTVWVDGQLPFDAGVSWVPSDLEGPVPVTKNDLERPASIAVRGVDVTVRHLKLFRDTYYTTMTNDAAGGGDAGNVNFGNPNAWGPLAKLPVLTMYVQPGHYLCLGDNSPGSSDARSWGLVPQRLLLGRAVLVYYPFLRGGRIR